MEDRYSLCENEKLTLDNSLKESQAKHVEHEQELALAAKKLENF